MKSDIDGIFDQNPHLHPDAKLIPEVTDLIQAEQILRKYKIEKLPLVDENNILREIALGKTTKEIAVEKNLSESLSG